MVGYKHRYLFYFLLPFFLVFQANGNDRSVYPLNCQDIQSRLKCPALTHLGNWEEIYTAALASITAILRSTDFEVF